MAKSTYATILRGVRKHLGENESPDRKTRIEELKRDLLQSNTPVKSSTLAREYEALRKDRDKLDEQLWKLNLRLEAVSQLLITQMEGDGITSLKLESGRSVSSFMEPYPNVFDHEAFRVWCTQNGYLEQMSLHPSKRLEIIRERLQAGEGKYDEEGRLVVGVPGISVFAKDKLRLGGER